MKKVQLNQIGPTPYEPTNYDENVSAYGYVEYGLDNLFPQFLVELFHASPTHNALTQTKAQMINGDGFKPTDLDSRLLFASWGMDDNLRRVCLDLCIQGGYALEIQWSIDREHIANVSHLPFENVRADEEDDNEQVNYYWYSKDWLDSSLEPVKVCTFDVERKNDHPTQILYVKPFTPGSQYYPKPDYIGALSYIELEREIGLYHINNIQNGLSPSMSIHFKNGIPSEIERNEIRRDIESQMTGAKGAGKVWITYSDAPDQKPDFEPILLSDADKQYQFLSEEVTAKIMVGHRVTNPMMFGVLVPGKLGGGEEMEVSNRLFEEHVIQPARNVVIESLKIVLDASDADSSFEPAAEPAPPVEEPVAEPDLSAVTLALQESGEQMDTDEWELIDERAVNYKQEDRLDALWAFATVISSSPNQKSEQDGEVIKVRYKYAPDSVSDNSRDFCRKMVSASKVYRKEDIQAASAQAVNPGWGPRGADTYDCWLYKGGGNCHHYWMRQTYLRKKNSKISVNEARRIIRQLPKGEQGGELPVNDPRVAKLPVDQPNAGFLKPRK